MPVGQPANDPFLFAKRDALYIFPRAFLSGDGHATFAHDPGKIR